MSRVVYSDQSASLDQEALRAANNVRLVTGAEEGTGVNALPAGVYGFTYSPALPNAPLFGVRRFRCYETHKLASDTYLIGFATPDAAAQIASAAQASVVIQPEADGEATVMVSIPYSRILRHRQYAAPNEHGFTVTLG